MVEAKRSLRFLFLIPFYKTMDVIAVQALMVMIADLTQQGHFWRVAYTSTANIACARNNLFAQAVKNADNFDYVISIDSDHVYSSRALFTLIDKIEKNNLPMLSAVYRTRHGTEYAMAKMDDGTGKPQMFKYDPANPITGIQECYFVGFGFIVFTPAFLKDMTGRYESLFSMDSRDNRGEDVFFCKLAREAGYKIYADFDTRVGHLATVAF